MFRAMKHVFIVNPAAGKSDRTESYRKLIDAAFVPRGLQYELLVSQAPGDCRKLAQQAAASGEAVRLYACGGDGTLNEVVNGVIGCPNAAVTHYPGGSGNDAIKIFDDPAAFTSIERLLSAEEAPFDLIRCNDSYALNVLSIGFDARVGTDIARFKRLPLVTGKGAYAAWMGHRPSSRSRTQRPPSSRKRVSPFSVTSAARTCSPSGPGMAR